MDGDEEEQREVEALFEKAEEALGTPDHEEVLRIADEVIARGYSAGFVIKARALAGLDREPEARTLLERAVEIAPDDASLWSYLGDYRSNAGDYTGAHAAFRRAAELDADARGECIVNDALVYLREKDASAALARLDEVGTPASPALRALASRTRGWVLNELRRYEDAIVFCGRELEALESIEGIDDEDRREFELSLGHLMTSKAEALWRGRRDRTAAIELCCDAADYMHNLRDHLHLVREIEDLDAEGARRLRLTCRGTATFDGPPEKVLPFLVVYFVVARTPEEGLEFARRFEPRDWRTSLVLHEEETEEGAPPDKRGVYVRSGHIFAEQG